MKQRILKRKLHIMMITNIQLSVNVKTITRYQTDTVLIVTPDAVRDAYSRRVILVVELIFKAYSIAKALTKIFHSQLPKKVVNTA